MYKSYCLSCKKEFSVHAYKIKKGYGRYCSIKCFANDNYPKIMVKCKNCNREYRVPPSHPAKNRSIFCTKKCYTAAQKKGLYPPWNKGTKTFDDKAYLKRYSPAYRYKLKKDVLNHYGHKCACCGETTFEFLTLDHIDGNGAKHRKRVGNVYSWLRKNNYPSGYQILCFNCNCAKGFYGKCPHQNKEGDRDDKRNSKSKR